MKRYLIFFGSVYYPTGGMHDMIGQTITIEKGIEIVNKELMKDFTVDESQTEEHLKYQLKFSWSHIYDTEEQKIVFEIN